MAEQKPLVDGIKLPDRKNQYDILDFSSELGSDEKKIRNQVFAEKIYPMIKIFDHLPTHTPSNLNEQFAIYNGVLYAYINGTWKTPIWTNPVSFQCVTGDLSRTTGDGTGTQEITVGFEPKLIKITARAGGQGWSVGTATTTSSLRVLYQYYDGAWEFGINTVNIIQAYNNGATQSGVATVSAIGATSFTLNWTTMGVNTSFIYEVYG